MSSFLRTLPTLGLAVAFVLTSFSVASAAPRFDPTGYWKTIDDDQKIPRSVIHITRDAKGKLQGKIVALFRKADENPLPRCEDCDGKFKNKPALGMRMMWDVEFDEHDDGEDEWEDGEILDPGNGKTYGCEVTQLSKSKLKVRGYLGFSALGRTQRWYRTSLPAKKDGCRRIVLIDSKGKVLPDDQQKCVPE